MAGDDDDARADVELRWSTLAGRLRTSDLLGRRLEP
jgi:hypothetical protein